MKIKKGDQVTIIAGKDRGKRGAVVRVLPAQDKVVVDGINIVKRHQKKKKENEKGERVEMAAPVHVSNVQLIDTTSGKPTRVGYRVEGGEKIRIAKKSGKAIK